MMAEIETTEPEAEIEVETEDVELEVGEEVAEAEAEDEFAIEIEGEEVIDEPPLVKQLRNEIRDRDRELAEHRKANQPKIELGTKPTLESCEWDEDRFEIELDAYKERERKIANQEQEAQKAAEVRNQTFQRSVANYRAKAAALPVKDFEQAEQALVATLPEIMQSALLMYAQDPAKVGYALYKHPAKLAQLSQETDPIKFVLAIHELERNLKVVNRKKPPAPESETIQRGSAPNSGSQMSKKAEEALAKGDIKGFRELRKQQKAA
jgi:hypothetical protein